MDLYSEPIEVELDTERVPHSPRAFACRGERHAVTQVLQSWMDAGFADRHRRRHQWWERRKRTCFRVRTETGETWDLYLDRGGPSRRWFVARRWRADEEPG